MDDKDHIQYLALAEEIKSMAKADKEMRDRGETKVREGDWSDFDKNVDIKNTTRMKEIVEQIGWPSINKVGSSASYDAWLLVQHADLDPDFQESCLELMKALPEGEILKKNIAFLEDRVRIHQGKPQVYGTQFQPKEDGTYTPGPIEDPEHVDERRASMGLDSLEESTKRINEH